MIFGCGKLAALKSEEKQLCSVSALRVIEFLFDVLAFEILLTTGRAMSYVLTLGRASRHDGLAEVIGIVFWVDMFVAAGVLVASL